ncbi:mitochondrial import inner membrane translocase subunit tim23-1 [Phtheirospermum japonicum]|uniref:Mitochondrial import inner membrane translocase subunit tim23-1 n=1 Tax=Phtheirospermum japonicum TaxID=374723 RepID=A0A830CCS3_9LAMI|nr:mitochondrial import inner membrane translocase subunit tim23-1 [Phtheirospermum japonicum]
MKHRTYQITSLRRSPARSADHGARISPTTSGLAISPARLPALLGVSPPASRLSSRSTP